MAHGRREWGAVPEDVAVATCLGAIERGINLIDTAPIYGHGRSEEIIGKAIRAHGRREDFFVATKAGLEWNERGVFTNSTESRLRKEIEDSLRRLGTETIDLYQVHWPDPLVPVPEVAALLASFQREGKVRALGVSNFSVAQMEEFRSVAPLASNQPPYNLFERQIDGDILPWCAANGVAVLTWSTLCRSMLAGRAHRGMKFDSKTFVTTIPSSRSRASASTGRPSRDLPSWRRKSMVSRYSSWPCAGCWTAPASP